MAKKRRIPKYRHHKPTGQAVVTLNGRDHYLGAYDTPKSRERYGRLIAEWSAHGYRLPREDRDEKDGELTIVELIAAYWQLRKTVQVL